MDSESWKDNGGVTGSIATFNGELFVTQTAENQTAIAHLIEELRDDKAGMVRIRADWVLLAPSEASKLLIKGDDDTAALPEVSREYLRGLPETTVRYSGQIACFSGQTVHLASGRARNMVTNVTPVVAPGAIGMDPTVDLVQDGVSLEVSATLSTGSAIVDLASIVSEGGKTAAVPSTQPAMPALDQIDKVVQHFHTTVQVPLNKPVLVGGSTVDPTVDQPAGKRLYLIIEADNGK